MSKLLFRHPLAAPRRLAASGNGGRHLAAKLNPEDFTDRSEPVLDFQQAVSRAITRFFDVRFS